MLSGKITATDEGLARGHLAALLPVALAQYGYDGDNVVQMRNDTTVIHVDHQATVTLRPGGVYLFEQPVVESGR